MAPIAQAFADTLSNNVILSSVLPRLIKGSNNNQVNQFFTQYFPLVYLIIGLTIALFFIVLVVSLLHRLLVISLQLRHAYTILEIKPPQETLQSSYTTQQLFNLIHGLANQKSFWERLIGYQKSYAFEIVSTKNDGIRYLLRVDRDDADLIKKSLISYLPGISVSQVKDYLIDTLSNRNTTIAEFKLARHFAFPLRGQVDLKEHDPIAYITGSMTKLSPDEVVVFQLVSSPVNKSSLGDIKRISRLIYTNKDLVIGLKSSNAINQIFSVFKLLLLVIFYIITLPLGLFIFLVSDGREGPFLGLPFSGDRDKTANPYQEELEKMVKNKLDQPLFTTSMRLSVIDNKRDASKRIRGFISSLSSFSNSSYQSIRRVRTLRLDLIEKIKLHTFRRRILNPIQSSIFSVSEVSDLYHFPFTATTRTEDIQKIHSKELPAPVSLKKATDLDVVFAKNTYGGSTTKLGLTDDDRSRHVYILGQTGSGKSTIIYHMAKDDIQKGRGIALIDPHGDLAEDLLATIPENRISDCIFFNPFDLAYPVGVNLLELSSGLKGDELEQEKEMVCEGVISIFRRIFSNDEKANAHRIEYILRNTMYTVFTIPNATIFTVYELLTNPKYQKKITRELTDENLKNFWKNEFGKAGNFQVVKMVSGVTAKIGRFLFSPTAKRILEQPKSSISFDEILETGKILICNLSEGKLGEDTSQLLGTTIITKIQLAAMRRERKSTGKRKPFYVFVDEFQNFATSSFTKLLSGGRKFGLRMTIAEQSTAQQDDRNIVNVILANTGTVICFRTASPIDAKLMADQFAPYVDKSDINNLPRYNFYMRLAAVNPEEPFSGTTIPIDEVVDKQKVKAVIESSRKNFAIQYVAKTQSETKTNQKSKLPQSLTKSSSVLP